jgi:CRISPR-associated protein Cmr1
MMEFQLRTLTQIWTGGINQKSDMLHETGIIGSLRWWYESIIRGYGGYACDPSDKEWQCKSTDLKHCAVCDLFGCSGWGGKFRLRVLDENKKTITRNLMPNTTIIFEIIPLRNISDEERWLLKKTMEMICDFGSIGGKTIFKPSEDQAKDYKLHHQDFGLLQKIAFTGYPEKMSPGEIQSFLKSFKTRNDNKSNQVNWQVVSENIYNQYPNFRYFLFCKDKYLNRLDINKLTGYPIPSSPYLEQKQWLKGEIGKKSKLIFSFKTRNCFWCYSKQDENAFRDLKAHLINTLGSVKLIEGRSLL